MNEYDGVITKPELTDEAFSDCGIIEHGWLKDAASKVHKYVDRWRGKNGKWYYSYKSKAQELGAKANRAIRGFKADEISDNTLNEYTSGTIDGAHRRIVGKTRRYINWGKDSGKAGSRDTSMRGEYSQPYVEPTRVNRPKRKNITKRGYSGSQGSGESKRQRNLGTRKSVNKGTAGKKRAKVEGYSNDLKYRGYDDAIVKPAGYRLVNDAGSGNTSKVGYNPKRISKLASERDRERAQLNLLKTINNTPVLKKGKRTNRSRWNRTF